MNGETGVSCLFAQQNQEKLMKKIIINYGGLSGIITVALMTIAWAFSDKIGFRYGMLVGFTSMILSMSVMYFAMAAYRDKIGSGRISFGKAIQIGLLIGLISSIFYVATWAVVYHTLMPDFFDKYAAYITEEMAKNGKSAEAIQKQMEQMKAYKEGYQNPVMFVAYTFIEPLPAVIVVSLVSALIIKKNKPQSHIA